MPIAAPYYTSGDSLALTFIKVFGTTFDLRDYAKKLDIWNNNIPARWKRDDLLLLELAELPAYGFERKTEIIRHFGAGEWQFEMHVIFRLAGALAGNASRHHEPVLEKLRRQFDKIAIHAGA